MNTRKIGVLALVALLSAAHMAAQTVPAEITTMLADADTVWGGVKTFVVGVVVFTVLIGIAKKMRRA